MITGIVAFVLQYAASGALEAPLLQQDISGLPLLDLLLSSTAILHWYLFDRSVQGKLMLKDYKIHLPNLQMRHNASFC